MYIYSLNPKRHDLPLALVKPLLRACMPGPHEISNITNGYTLSPACPFARVRLFSQLPLLCDSQGFLVEAKPRSSVFPDMDVESYGLVLRDIAKRS